MGEASTILMSVQKGDLWRVEITWPNGTLHHFGKFRSEQEAQGWIRAHSSLTAHVVQVSDIRRKAAGRRPRSAVDEAKGGDSV